MSEPTHPPSLSLPPSSLAVLAATTAHDLNNALAAILGMASALKSRTAMDPFLGKGLETILSACDRGRVLVQNLSHFAHATLPAGEPIAPAALFDAVVGHLRAKAPETVTVRCSIDPDLPDLHGHAALILEGLQALVCNALEALPQGGQLVFTCRRNSQDQVEWTVEDNGPGMPPEVLARAKEPFFTTKPESQGLGLALAHGMMKLHGARLDLESTPGVGTRATVAFPPSPARP